MLQYGQSVSQSVQITVSTSICSICFFCRRDEGKQIRRRLNSGGVHIITPPRRGPRSSDYYFAFGGHEAQQSSINAAATAFTAPGSDGAGGEGSGLDVEDFADLAGDLDATLGFDGGDLAAPEVRVVMSFGASRNTGSGEIFVAMFEVGAGEEEMVVRPEEMVGRTECKWSEVIPSWSRRFPLCSDACILFPRVALASIRRKKDKALFYPIGEGNVSHPEDSLALEYQDDTFLTHGSNPYKVYSKTVCCSLCG